MTTLTKTPMWLIERVAQEELDALEVEQLRERLAAEGRSLDEEVARLHASDRAILAELPRTRMAAEIRQRAAKQAAAGTVRRSRLPALILPTLVAGSLALGLVWIRGNGGPGTGVAGRPDLQRGGDDEVGLKGDTASSPRLLVYRHKPGAPVGLANSERLAGGARTARGDVLQLAYAKANEGQFGVLLSIDGVGRVTQHMPEEGARTSAPLTPTREIPLPSAYELDDAPAFERFVLITRTRPFPVGVALEAARALASQGPSAQTLPLALDPSYQQYSVLLHKIGEGAR